MVRDGKLSSYENAEIVERNVDFENDDEKKSDISLRKFLTS